MIPRRSLIEEAFSRHRSVLTAGSGHVRSAQIVAEGASHAHLCSTRAVSKQRRMFVTSVAL